MCRFVISLGVGLDTVYRIGVNVFLFRFRFGTFTELPPPRPFLYCTQKTS